ncbi:hypothetical protein [Natronolimnohabitans innermongolicus]|uniref:Uncharacterized protein n=1 Tax=Natronolimnohabitans innermongolicus JCM 12255 TaxID=1227499 RepID=L9X7B8_9EURY|nr:hypothetical protein [Natronolimnohabitans innermongolicus]ELY57610.1 hypothetical protein C493_09011 [Natronolimnohabitans innermongolicus JCM 12255]
MLAGAPAAMAGGADDVQADSVHALENGEDLYLAFGADLEDQSLDEFIEAHAHGDIEQESNAEVVQHQDVDQVNINEQGDAVSISIDGGEATAVQESNQLNANDQTGTVSAENEVATAYETQFEDVGNVYLIVGNGDSQQYDGWGVTDEKGDKETVTQSAEAVVTQSQDVAQANVNEQSTALAIANNGSEATAIQQTDQYNENRQEGAAESTNVYAGGGDYVEQSASAFLGQEQVVEQTNVNEQGAAVAIAVGEDSVATAIQVTDQTNVNEQLGAAEAANVYAGMPGMNVATAGDDVESSTVETQVPSDDKKDDKDEGQTATSSVDQEQSVEQLNVNLQNSAVALADNGSEASAVQLAHQHNYNAQIGSAAALNVYAGPSLDFDSEAMTSSTTVTIGGDDLEDAPGVSYDYDTNAEQTSDVTQDATAALEQSQFVTQNNVNEQHSAIAIAEDGGDASATQVSMQENENVQISAVAATNVWIDA